MSRKKKEKQPNWPADKIERWSIDKLIPQANNARTHTDEQIAQIAGSMKEWGWTNPILIDEGGAIIAGHGRVMAARLLDIDSIPAIVAKGWTKAQIKAYALADNQIPLNAGWDVDLLRIELQGLNDLDFDLGMIGFPDVKVLMDEKKYQYLDGKKGSMIKTYCQPPFSVLDTRKEDWMSRRKEWRSLIGDKAESREKKIPGFLSLPLAEMNNSSSLLDAVLAETMVAWFGRDGGVVFDPFAGDTVFGFVAGSLGMKFQGIELRQEQVDINQKRCADAGLSCKYYCDTGKNMDKYIKDKTIDLVFSCPPYANLEVYSDDPQDLSAMSHADFFQSYKEILQNTYSKLKNNRFAVIVMGEVRHKDGGYLGTIPKTIQFMEEVGYIYYNEIILINSIGTLPIRAGMVMQSSRKVGKMHQNILVFLKGNAKKASADLGVINMNVEADDADGG